MNIILKEGGRKMMSMVRYFVTKAAMKFHDFFSKENGEVNIVTIVVLIGIAVLLAIVFKGAITNLLNTLFGTIENNALNVIGNN